MRLIDAKQMEKQIKQVFANSNPVLMGQMLRWTRLQTTVDAVKVVRCGQCRHMKLLDGVFCFCGIWNAPNAMGANGFCSYGERKDK